MIIGGRRSCGKTTELVRKSNKEWLYIVCADQQRVRVITDIARNLELDIPFPITVDELPLRSSYINSVLVDDIEDVVTRLIRKPIEMVSSSLKFKDL